MDPDSAKVPLLENEPNKKDTSLLSKTQIIPKNPCITYLCCCCSDSYDLTINEYNAFNSLLRQCDITFNKSDSDHQSKLSTFFTNAKTEILKHKPQLQNEQPGPLWKEFGFQSEIPESDFRGGGLISLECMIHFHKDFPNELGEMFDTEYFCFAVITIKICFSIRLLFCLFSQEEMERQKQTTKIKICNRKEMKMFCKGLFMEEEFFYNLVDIGMLLIWKVYKERFEVEKKELNILKVDPIVSEVVGIVGRVFMEEKDYGSIKKRLMNEYSKK